MSRGGTADKCQGQMEFPRAEFPTFTYFRYNNGHLSPLWQWYLHQSSADSVAPGRWAETCFNVCDIMKYLHNAAEGFMSFEKILLHSISIVTSTAPGETKPAMEIHYFSHFELALDKNCVH
jgi:hypothetical protein